MSSQELLQAALARNKALIGLRPGPEDSDADMVFIVGTRADFLKNPPRFDRIIFEGIVQELNHPTEQRVGVVDDQLVTQITVPDLPGAAEIVDEIADAVSIGVVIATWALSRVYKQIAFNRVVLEVQKIRLLKAARVSLFGVSEAKRAKGVIKAAKISTKVASRSAKQARLISKVSKVRFIATRVGLKVLFKGVLLPLALAVDVVIVGHRVLQGIERAGFEGGAGALVGGVADVLTFGLAESATTTLEFKTETFVKKLSFAGRALAAFRSFRI